MGVNKRSDVVAVAFGAGATITLLGTFLRWVYSGSVGRSSYRLVGLIERLGFAPNGPIDVAMRCWPFVPLLLVAAVLAGIWQRPMIAGAIGALVSIFVGLIAAALLVAAKTTDVLRLGRGPWVSACGALLLLVASALMLLWRDRSVDPDAALTPDVA